MLNDYVGSQEGFFQLNFGAATAEKSPIEKSSMDSIESSQNGQELQESKGWWNIKDAPLAGNRRWRLGLPLKVVQAADAIRSWHGRNSYTRVDAKIYHLGGGFKCLFFCSPAWASDPIWLVCLIGLKPPTGRICSVSISGFQSQPSQVVEFYNQQYPFAERTNPTCKGRPIILAQGIG